MQVEQTNLPIKLKTAEKAWWYDHYTSTLVDIQQGENKSIHYTFVEGSDITIQPSLNGLELTLTPSLNMMKVGFSNKVKVTSSEECYQLLFSIKNYKYHNDNNGEWVIFLVKASTTFILVYHNQCLYLVEEFVIGDLEQTLISIAEEYARLKS